MCMGEFQNLTEISQAIFKRSSFNVFGIFLRKTGINQNSFAFACFYKKSRNTNNSTICMDGKESEIKNGHRDGMAL